MKFLLFIAASVALCPTIYFLRSSIRAWNDEQLKMKSQMKFDPHESVTREWTRLIRTYLRLPVDHHYGSHAIVLLAALFLSRSGPILELGMGLTSTSLLHRFSVAQNRFLLSTDSDLRWINYFRSIIVNRTQHEFLHIEVNTEMGVEWATSSLADRKNWSLVLIDHRPGPRRKFDLMLYSQRSDLVILHDTESSVLYQYDEGLRYYPFRYRFTRLKTYTDVLSAKNGMLIEKIRRLLESTPESVFANTTSEKQR